MDITYMLVQSQRCFRMARECSDAQIAAQLEEVSREFEEKADEFGARMARELLHPSHKVSDIDQGAEPGAARGTGPRGQRVRREFRLLTAALG